MFTLIIQAATCFNSMSYPAKPCKSLCNRMQQHFPKFTIFDKNGQLPVICWYSFGVTPYCFMNALPKLLLE